MAERQGLFSKARRTLAGKRKAPVHEARTALDGGALFDLGRLQTCPRGENEAAIRQLCQAVPLSAEAVLCRALGRYKMYVDPADTGLSPHLMLDGYWEMWVTEAMLGFVRSGMTAVDVGANLGYYTLLLGDLVGSGGRVLAAEPNPRIMSHLRRSVQVNGFGGRVSLHPEPLAARAGEPVLLHVPDGLPQNAFLGSEAGAGMVTHALTTTTLDDLVGDGAVDFIKIDAEGAEEAIWHGMGRVLARATPLVVFIEFTPNRYSDPAAFLRQMLDSRFTLAVVDSNAGVQPISFDAVLAPPTHVDRMLVLAR